MRASFHLNIRTISSKTAKVLFQTWELLLFLCYHFGNCFFSLSLSFFFLFFFIVTESVYCCFIYLIFLRGSQEGEWGSSINNKYDLFKSCKIKTSGAQIPASDAAPCDLISKIVTAPHLVGLCKEETKWDPGCRKFDHIENIFGHIIIIIILSFIQKCASNYKKVKSPCLWVLCSSKSFISQFNFQGDTECNVNLSAHIQWSLSIQNKDFALISVTFNHLLKVDYPLVWDGKLCSRIVLYN